MAIPRRKLKYVRLLAEFEALYYSSRLISEGVINLLRLLPDFETQHVRVLSPSCKQAPYCIEEDNFESWLRAGSMLHRVIIIIILSLK